MVQDVFGLLVVADVGAMEKLHHFPVHGAGSDSYLVPGLLSLGGGALQVKQFPFDLAELGQGCQCDLFGDLVDWPPLACLVRRRHIQVSGDLD